MATYYYSYTNTWYEDDLGGSFNEFYAAQEENCSSREWDSQENTI